MTLPSLRPEDLSPVLEAAVGWPGRVGSIIVEPIPYTVWNRASGGVFKVHVTMGAGGAAPPLVLKVVRHRSWKPTKAQLRDQLDNGGDEPDDIAWWRREGEMFRSGLTGLYRPPFRPIRCYLVQDRTPDEMWLWLEQAPGALGLAWTDAQLFAAAHALGQVQAAPLQFEAPPWLARPLATLESTIHRAELLSLCEDPRTWANPVVRALRPEPARLAQRCWASFDAMRARLMSFPHILQHGDLAPFNAFEFQGRFIAIDWAMSRMGPRGEDLAALVLSTAGSSDDPSTLVDRGEQALDAYLSGLAAAGWRGDEREVRFTYKAFGMAQLGLLIGLNVHKAMDDAWIASKGPEFDLAADMARRFATSEALLNAFAADPIGRSLLA